MILTIGHSNKPFEKFLPVLQRHNATHLIDIRSKPYSRWNPAFNKANLQQACKANGIAYGWRGNVLGGFSDPNQAMKDKLNEVAQFAGDSEQHNVVLMCAELAFTDCHRHWWAGRYLHQKLGTHVTHLRTDSDLTYEVTDELFKQFPVPADYLGEYDILAD